MCGSTSGACGPSWSPTGVSRSILTQPRAGRTGSRRSELAPLPLAGAGFIEIEFTQPPAPPATCTPFLWLPANGDMTPTPQPTLADGKMNANLFCSGHAFLPDGNLLVAGGHLADSHGLNQATIYDSATNTWTPTAAVSLVEFETSSPAPLTCRATAVVDAGGRPGHDPGLPRQARVVHVIAGDPHDPI